MAPVLVTLADSQLSNTGASMATRTTPSSSRSPTQVRWNSSRKLQPEEVEQGSILMLPEDHSVPVRYATSSEKVRDRIYNHPIIVLSRPAKDLDIIYFITMTSFSRKGLSKFNGKVLVDRMTEHMPVAPAKSYLSRPPGAPPYQRLTFEHGAQMELDSYAKFQSIYMMQLKDARPYSNKTTPMSLRLDQQSVKALLHECHKTTPDLDLSVPQFIRASSISTRTSMDRRPLTSQNAVPSPRIDTGESSKASHFGEPSITERQPLLTPSSQPATQQQRDHDDLQHPRLGAWLWSCFTFARLCIAIRRCLSVLQMAQE